MTLEISFFFMIYGMNMDFYEKVDKNYSFVMDFVEILVGLIRIHGCGENECKI